MSERTDTQNKRYVVIAVETQQVVAEGLRTRAEARIKKRELEYAYRAKNEFRPVKSQYYVETDADHPSGAGIYLH